MDPQKSAEFRQQSETGPSSPPESREASRKTGVVNDARVSLEVEKTRESRRW